MVVNNFLISFYLYSNRIVIQLLGDSISDDAAASEIVAILNANSSLLPFDVDQVSVVEIYDDDSDNQLSGETIAVISGAATFFVLMIFVVVMVVCVRRKNRTPTTRSLRFEDNY